jgi:hypothetical protein
MTGGNLARAKRTAFSRRAPRPSSGWSTRHANSANAKWPSPTRAHMPTRKKWGEGMGAGINVF